MVWLSRSQRKMLRELVSADRDGGARRYMTGKWFRHERAVGFEHVGYAVPLSDDFPDEISDLRALRRKGLITGVPGDLTDEGREWFDERAERRGHDLLLAVLTALVTIALTALAVRLGVPQ